MQGGLIKAGMKLGSGLKVVLGLVLGMDRCNLGTAVTWQQVMHNLGWKDEGIRAIGLFGDKFGY